MWERYTSPVTAYLRQRGGNHNTLDDYRLIVNDDFAAL